MAKVIASSVRKGNVLDLAVGSWVYARAKERGELVEVPDFFWELTR